ncbi:hypothetical protein J2858_000844 [Neorhizobium galegae]|uniref:hypothetical protein n=1 Tax=Neorhizobium galegae TaxID=399 RepID=UPI001AE1E1F6|nr:hypothetical protein [Neorhizobium galegae]MBP2547951.1 hypothetical protein [Neorhizobium galegae]
MTVTLKQKTVRLSGSCGVEEADTLVEYLTSRPDLEVDLRAATSIHTALWQALMMFRPPITGPAPPPLLPDAVISAVTRFLTRPL